MAEAQRLLKKLSSIETPTHSERSDYKEPPNPVRDPPPRLSDTLTSSPQQSQHATPLHRTTSSTYRENIQYRHDSPRDTCDSKIDRERQQRFLTSKQKSCDDLLLSSLSEVR